MAASFTARRPEASSATSPWVRVGPRTVALVSPSSASYSTQGTVAPTPPTGRPTVSRSSPVWPCQVAEIWTVPGATPRARPGAATEATEASALDQVASAVTSFSLPSE